MSSTQPGGGKSQRQQDELAERLLARRKQVAATGTGGTIPPCPRVGDAFALSSAQQRLWFLEQLDPGSPTYNNCFAYRAVGPIDIPALERSFTELVRRHESLRSTFHEEDGVPRQRVRPPFRVRIPVVEVGGEAGPAREARAMALAVESFRERFDLAEGPLLRISLLRCAPDDHLLLVRIHHIVSDGWSMGVVTREIGALYEAFRAGRAPSLPAPPLQYVDFAHAQNGWLEGHELDGQLAHWRKRLKDAPSGTELVTDRPRPAVQRFGGAIVTRKLAPEVWEGVKALARAGEATPFMVLLAGYQALLHRYTGSDDIIVGTPIANRRRAELEGLIGFFVNMLVVRTDAGGDPPFSELLRRTKEEALAAFSNQDVPFERVVAELQPKRDLARSPLFQLAFLYQNAPLREVAIQDLKLTPVAVDAGVAKYDLMVQAQEVDGQLVLTGELSTDLFDRETIQDLLLHYERLLGGAVARPDTRLSRLPLVGHEEARRQEQGRARAEMPPGGTVHGLFEAQVARTPDATAATYQDESITYRRLDERASALAARLQALGARPGVVVGLCCHRSTDMLVGLLGILKSGAAYLPLDPSFPRERLEYILQDAGAPLLVTETKLLGALPEAKAERVLLDGPREAAAAPAPAEKPPPAGERDLAYVIYTSGSTGRPKGVEVEHRSVATFLRSTARRPGLKAEDVLLAVTTISFDIAVLELFLPLTVGARVVVVSREVASQGPALMAEIARSGATAMQATPATWRLLLQSGWRGSAGMKVLCGGEALPLDLAESLLRLRVSLWNMYGPTETTIWSMAHPVRPGDPVVPLGEPLDNTRIHVLDGALQPAPAGVPGELCIGGDGVARGYRGRPELTAERFVPLPAGAGERIYRTGDLVRRRSNGQVEFLGRLDHQVKVRGFRIELGEIEHALMQDPSVSRAVVVAREDGGEKRLVGYVVPEEGRKVEGHALRHRLLERLPEYMVPAAYVALEEIPLTPNGKVDRRALPAPGREASAGIEAYAEPRNDTERGLVELFKELLGADRVGIYDDFFRLGGHSLMVTRLIAGIRTRFGVVLSTQSLFESPTPALLADAIESVRAGSAVPTMARSVAELRPEIRLDPSITAGAPPVDVTAPPRNVFLTGATGFVGSFVLRELLDRSQATIHCLVRAKDAEEGRARIHAVLRRYGIAGETLDPRVVAVPGDLASPRLGLDAATWDRLAGTADLVIHGGAFVNFVYPFSALKAANVQGTEEVLRLAAQARLKPVHFLGSLAVYQYHQNDPWFRDADDLRPHNVLYSGYDQTKWVSEQVVRLAMARGMPCAIYRPALTSGHSVTGVSPDTYFLFNILKGWLQQGFIPELHFNLEMTPVDYVSQVVVHHALDHRSLGKTFNLVNTNTMPIEDFVRMLDRTFGFTGLKQLPYHDWRKRVCEVAADDPESAYYPFLDIFRDEARFESHRPDHSRMARFDCSNAEEAVRSGHVAPAPQLDETLFRRYYDYFVRTSFLATPEEVKR